MVRKRAGSKGEEEPGGRPGDDPGARERHLRTPPPLLEGREPFEGGEILDELQGELGGLLWNTLRSVTLWARAEPSRRSQLAAPQAAARRAEELAAVEVPEPLAAPLTSLARLLSEPAGVESATVAAGCRAVAEWANGRGMIGTALAFLQAAALAQPNDAKLSYAVGRMARRHGEPTRAESWLQWAIAQARRNGDWEIYTLVYAGLGNLYAERGNFPAGRRALTRALRSAQRRGFRRLEGETLHDLFAIAAETGRVREAEHLAGATLEIYGSGHPRLPYLAHDMAFLWVERGMYRPALEVIRTLRRHIAVPRDRAMLLSALARAAAGAGERVEYETAWAEAEPALAALADGENAAPSWLNLAYGAEMAGDVERGLAAARTAVRIAAATREGKLRLSAEALLDRLSKGTPTPRPAAPVGAAQARRAEQSEQLAERLSSSLLAAR